MPANSCFLTWVVVTRAFTSESFAKLFIDVVCSFLGMNSSSQLKKKKMVF